MPNKHFSEDYVGYWRERVTSAVDGSKVADQAIFDHYIEMVALQHDDTVADIGCGYGRMFPVLSRYTKHIIGLDISAAMLREAAHLPYCCLLEAPMEATGLASGLLDSAIVWGTFDVVDQEKSLREANRILKDGGRLLLTGKNCRYRSDDQAAFIAERNAKLKDFPHHFTDVALLLSKLPTFGFALKFGCGFERRGDLGGNKSFPLPADGNGEYYEYLLILRKTGTPTSGTSVGIAREFSLTAEQLATDNGFSTDSVRSFFIQHKEQNHD